MKKPIMRFPFVVLLLVLSASPIFAASRVISWDDLRNGENIRFDDPFAKLTHNQLTDLSKVAYIRNQVDLQKGSADRISVQEEKQLVAQLTQQGLDVDWLLSQWKSVAEMRREKSNTAGAGVVGSNIRIPGYMMPLNTGPMGVTSFLLVPYVSTCSHVPPPPPNLVIHVSMADGVTPRGPFDAIWVEGLLQRKPEVYTPFIVDGTLNVEAMFTLKGTFVSDYSAKDSNVLTQGAISLFDSAHSWFGDIQRRLAILFTGAMTAIRDRDSSAPIWIGVLLAFIYGVLHTLGPGHGKAIVISYFVGHGGSLGRGIRMGSQIAVFHVLSAVIVALLTNFAIRQATGHAPSDFRLVKLISYAAITVIGVYMLWQALRNFMFKPAGHGHEHGLSAVGGDAGHHSGCGCGSHSTHHAGPAGWLALAVGAVPCTGALLILLFGLSHDLLGPAILMVAAISFGMAISMSGIGILTILGRRYADRKFTQKNSLPVRFGHAVRITAAALIVIIGVGFFSLTVAKDEPTKRALWDQANSSYVNNAIR